ncbi:MAG: hypothetical protein Q8936_12710 [Bacillota bacterium]|nr:hypothetical protein [Bacillota bacterium]
MKRNNTILLIIIILISFLLSACNFNTKTVKYSSKDLDEIKQTTKMGLQEAFNFSYETTTGDEGAENYTERILKEVHQTKEDIPKVIEFRKSIKLVENISIKKVYGIEIIDENNAIAKADYTEKTISTMKDGYNHNDTGYFDVKLKRENGKWLIDDFQRYVNK